MSSIRDGLQYHYGRNFKGLCDRIYKNGSSYLLIKIEKNRRLVFEQLNTLFELFLNSQLHSKIQMIFNEGLPSDYLYKILRIIKSTNIFTNEYYVECFQKSLELKISNIAIIIFENCLSFDFTLVLQALFKHQSAFVLRWIDTQLNQDYYLETFFYACTIGQEDVLRALMKKTFFSQLTPEKKQTLLAMSCQMGQEKVAQIFLSVQTRADGLADDKMPIFYHALMHNFSLSTLHTMLGLGANSKDRFKGNRTYLHIAASKNPSAAVDLLAKQQLSITEKDDNGWTPLHFAVDTNQANITSVLLNECKGPSINEIVDSLIAFACEHKKEIALQDLISWMIKKKVFFDITKIELLKQVALSCSFQLFLSFKDRFKKGIYKNILEKHLFFLELLIKQKKEIVFYLYFQEKIRLPYESEKIIDYFKEALNANLYDLANIIYENISEEFKSEQQLREVLTGQYFLKICKHGSVQLIKHLMKFPLNFEFRDEEGKTALMHIVIRDLSVFYEISKQIILPSLKKLIQQKDCNGLSMLYFACNNGNEKMCRHLLELEAEPFLGINGITILQKMASNGMRKTINLFSKTEAEKLSLILDFSDLLYCIQANDLQSIQRLCEKWIATEQLFQKEISIVYAPILECVKKQKLEICNYLLSMGFSPLEMTRNGLNTICMAVKTGQEDMALTLFNGLIDDEKREYANGISVLENAFEGHCCKLAFSLIPYTDIKILDALPFKWKFINDDISWALILMKINLFKQLPDGENILQEMKKINWEGGSTLIIDFIFYHLKSCPPDFDLSPLLEIDYRKNYRLEQVAATIQSEVYIHREIFDQRVPGFIEKLDLIHSQLTVREEKHILINEWVSQIYSGSFFINYENVRALTVLNKFYPISDLDKKIEEWYLNKPKYFEDLSS